MPRTRRIWTLVVATALVLAALSIPFHRPLLRAAGEALVAADPVTPADAIVLSLYSGAGGALEAADLVAAGMARRVVVFAEPPTVEGLEYRRRGAVYEDDTGRQVRHLAALGVSEVERVPVPEVGSHPEIDALQAWCRASGAKAVIVVTARDHSRRLGRILRRVLPPGTTVIVRPTTHSRFDPARWWESRTGRRIVLVEWQKLLLELVMHPGAG